jgi:hypothetical protein
VPAGGSLQLSLVYSNAFLQSEVNGYAAEAEAKLMPTQTDQGGGGSSGGSQQSNNDTALPVTPSTNPTPKPPAPPTFKAAGKASAKARGATVVVSAAETAACPPAGAVCAVDLTATGLVPATARVKRKDVVIGRVHFAIAAGKSRTLSFKLTADGARLLRKLKRMSVKLSFTGRAGSATPVTVKKTITIKAPVPRKRR